LAYIVGGFGGLPLYVRDGNAGEYPKLFRLLIGSILTSPAEKDSLRRAVEWIDYLDGRLRGLSRLSRFHSLPYSGVFIENVFSIF
jgi:hypothetical protein